MSSIDSPQHYPSTIPDQPYRVPLADGDLWVRAGFAAEAHHYAPGQWPGQVPQGHDSLYGIPEKGAFAVCDGASGETADGMDPARTARLAAKFLVGQFSEIPQGMSDKEMEAWADEQMDLATLLIDNQGGGRATALVAGPTLDEHGRPVVLLAGRGDSRAAASHEDVIPNRSLEYWEQFKDIRDAAHQYEQRLADGFNRYEITIDKGFQTWVGTPSARHKQVTQTAQLFLAPGKRERLVMASDGISGSDSNYGPSSFLSADVVGNALRGGTPQESIAYLFRMSTKQDDKAGWTIDFAYQPR